MSPILIFYHFLLFPGFQVFVKFGGVRSKRRKREKESGSKWERVAYIKTHTHLPICKTHFIFWWLCVSLQCYSEWWMLADWLALSFSPKSFFGWLFHLPTNGKMHTNEHSCIWHWTSVLPIHIDFLSLFWQRIWPEPRHRYTTIHHPPKQYPDNHNVGG